MNLTCRIPPSANRMGDEYINGLNTVRAHPMVSDCLPLRVLSVQRTLHTLCCSDAVVTYLGRTLPST
jgi:hypothetical protein